jgi:nitroreductase
MVYEALLKRRSIRSFTGQKVEKSKVDQLLRAALLSPTSRNIRPWEFVVVDDTSMLERLSRAKPHGASFIAHAALAVVVIADASQSDVWVEDTSIASTSLLLMVEELGLGACWVQIRQRPHDDKKSATEYVRELLKIPPRFEVESIIAVGYPEKKMPPYDENALLYEKIHYNAYGTNLSVEPKRSNI